MISVITKSKLTNSIQGSDSFSQSSFVHYCSRGMIEEVKNYIKCGMDVSFWDNAPIKTATRFGKVEITRLLKENGANIMAGNNEPIKNALKNGHDKIVLLFIEEYGADVQFDNNLLLKNAAILGNFELFATLHRKGADIKSIDRDIISKINNKSTKFTEHDNILYYIEGNTFVKE